MSLCPKYIEPRRTSDPTNLPLTLAEAKQHLHIDAAYEDARLNRVLSAVVSHLDGWNGELGLALITQTWRVELDRFPGRRRLDLQIGPVQSVTVKYSDSDNVEQTFASSNYSAHEDASGWFLQLDEDQDTWPDTYERADAVRIDVIAGYGANSSDVPEAIRQAICLIVDDWFENAGDTIIGKAAIQLPRGANALLRNYRKPAFA